MLNEAVNARLKLRELLKPFIGKEIGGFALWCADDKIYSFHIMINNGKYLEAIQKVVPKKINGFTIELVITDSALFH